MLPFAVEEPNRSLSARWGRLRQQLRDIRATIIWELLRAQWRWIVLVLVLAGMSFGATVAYANAIRDAIDHAIVEHTKPLTGYVHILVIAPIAGMFASFALRQGTTRIGYHIEYQVRVRLYERLQALDPRRLDVVATGQLLTRAVTDLAFLEVFVVIIPALGVTFVIITALAVIILIQSLPMAALAIVSIPVNAWLVLRIRYRLLGMSWTALNRRAEVTTAIDEAVRGIRVVKAFGREDHERARVAKAARGAFAVALNRIRLLAKYDLLLRFVPAVFTTLEVFLAGRLIQHHTFTIGKLLVLLYFAQALTLFSQSFSDIADAWNFARAGATRITELLDEIPPPPPEDAQPLPEPSTGLELRGVGFQAGGRELLAGLDLRVEHGQLVVVHGAPGSGKTLSSWLASGRLAPTHGQVALDGIDLTQIDPRELSRAILVLSEEPFLFGRSVRENLTVGAPSSERREVGDEQLWEALRAAAADGVVNELADGLDTVLGDRGMTLSGGQRQRLAVARALVQPPRILVLDDALSAVNPALEVDIVRRIRRAAPGMGVLCITRREGLESLASQVVVLPERDHDGVSPLAATIEPSSATAQSMMAAAISVFGGRIDPRLIKAIATVPADRDAPKVSEEDATESEIRPTVFTILRPLLVTVLLAGGVLLLASSVNLVPQGLFKFIVDDFKAGHHATADRTALYIAVLALAYGSINYVFRVRAARVNESVMYMLRRRVFQRLSRLGVDYYDRELPGQVAARVVYDLDRISTFLDNGLYFMMVNTTLLLLAMGVILVWSPPVAAVVLPFVPVLLFFSGVQVPIADRAYDRQRARLGAVVERFHEDTAGRYVIDAFDARNRARADFQERAWRLRQARRWSAGVSNGYIELMNCAGSLAGAALISRAGSLSIAGKLSIGSMVALELYLLSALGPIAFLSEAMGRLMAARASFRTLRRPFGAPILPIERDDAAPCPRLAGDLVLDHVTFNYPGTTRVVLDDVSLEIPPGTSIALVGPTGAGKSSIAKLVARIYDADAGAVLIDGHDVRDLELASYRRRLGVVPQDAFCFRGTVRDNIAYGRPDASDDEIVSAVDAVGAAHVLRSLPSGLASTVEEEGRNLTAAQRQVIALARALLTDPDVLILDEATSSLDGITEEGVLEAVRRIGRTTIFITHRLPVARRADLVAVVDGGQIVERGPHDDLIGHGGAYARLWAIGPEVTPDAVQEPTPGGAP